MGRCLVSKIKMKKKTVALLAPTGMLGSMLYKEFKDKYRLILVYRDPKKLAILNRSYGGIRKHKRVRYDLATLYDDYIDGFSTATIGQRAKKLISAIGKVDAVINCAGITKPHSLKDPVVTMFINGALPHVLSTIFGEKLIQITTDCAFSGVSGAPYDEDSPKTPNDLYGLSKSLGEPQGSLVLRTSIFGPEIYGHTMLLDWFLGQEGKTVSGFTNHLWNGVTTKEFARVCDLIIRRRKSFPKAGLFHIFSTSVSKYDMLVAFRKKYGVKVTIQKTRAAYAVDRRLKTEYSLCKNLTIPSFARMLSEL